jgi:hypothetical protein
MNEESPARVEARSLTALFPLGTRAENDAL